MKVTLARPHYGVYGARKVWFLLHLRRHPGGQLDRGRALWSPTGYTVSSAAVVSFVLRLPCAGRPRTHLVYADMKPGRRGVATAVPGLRTVQSSQPPRR